MRYPNTQAGSILSFLVVGAVLIIVTGTVFYVASRNMNDDKTAVSTPEVTLPGETDPSSGKSGDETSRTDDDKAKGSDNDNNDQSATDNKPSTDTSNSNASDVDELSQTGPADTAAQLIAIGGLSFAGAAFIRSRRKASL